MSFSTAAIWVPNPSVPLLEIVAVAPQALRLTTVPMAGALAAACRNSPMIERSAWILCSKWAISDRSAVGEEDPPENGRLSQFFTATTPIATIRPNLKMLMGNAG